MGRYGIAVIEAKGATVRIWEHAAGLNIADVITAYEITSTTGYVAIIPACTCDREPCTKLRCGEHFDHCHGAGYGKHEVHVRQLAAAVAKTYGSATAGRSKLKTVRYAPSDWERTQICAQW